MSTQLQRAAIEPKKFILYNLLTLSAYTLYWGWQMWEVVRRKQGTSYRFKSSLRSFVLFVTAFRLFPYIEGYERAAKKHKKWPVHAISLAMIYLLFVILCNVISYPIKTHPGLAISITVAVLGEIIILLPAVMAMNRLAGQDKTFIPPAKVNRVLAVITVIIWLLLWAVLLFPEN